MDEDFFGQLIVLGYNGHSQGSQRRSSTKFHLQRKPTATGVKKSCHYVVKAPKQTKAVLDRAQHSISYTLNRNQAIVVEYEPDPTTDMFQIGRSTEPQIDFTVVDTWLGLNAIEDANQKSPLTAVSPQSTISRYACRILIQRDFPHATTVYAAGFDASRNIFLGEKACKWKNSRGDIDGLTTNGILILHPSNSEANPDVFAWREVSVGGDIYTLRESRSSSQRGQKVDDENNQLEDGTLIDLCGATLLFRSAEGLRNSPTEEQLESRLAELNAGRPQCPVNLNTLVIPKGKSLLSVDDQMPLVYLSCGHVQGRHGWGHKQTSHTHECPLCYRESDRLIQLSMGMESAFHLDCENLSHAFNPCGHMASLRTIQYWSRIPLPQGTNSFRPVCPFCTSVLDPKKPYLRLIFQDHCSF